MNNLQQGQLKQTLLQKADELGLAPVGVAPVEGELRKAYFLKWLADGKHGDMAWMARDPERRATPSIVAPEARAILAFGLNYYQSESRRRGRIAKYALGKDYHKVMMNKLKKICAWLRENGGINKPYIDTGPLLEKPIAALAGLGWQGKNTMVLNAEHGQWLFLGFILTTLPFPADEPAKDRCGTCTRCIDICPTRAITAPYQLDATRCISYLTIELKEDIPFEMRPLIGDHLYGCDDCLDICPWNKWASPTNETAFARRDYPDLRDMLHFDDSAFRERFAGSPIKRIGRSRWLRNVCVVLGNIGTPDDLPALREAAADPDQMVARHAKWALEEIQSRNT